MASSEPFLSQDQTQTSDSRQVPSYSHVRPHHTYRQHWNAGPYPRQRQDTLPVHPQIQWIRHDLGVNIAVEGGRRGKKIKKRASIARRKDNASVSADYVHTKHVSPPVATHRPLRWGPHGPPRQHIRPQAPPVPEMSHSTLDANPVDQSLDAILADSSIPDPTPMSFEEECRMEWYEADPEMEIEVPIEPLALDAKIEEIKRSWR